MPASLPAELRPFQLRHVPVQADPSAGPDLRGRGTRHDLWRQEIQTPQPFLAAVGRKGPHAFGVGQCAEGRVVDLVGGGRGIRGCPGLLCWSCHGEKGCGLKLTLGCSSYEWETTAGACAMLEKQCCK